MIRTRVLPVVLLFVALTPLVGCSTGEKRELLSEIDAYYSDLSDCDWDAFRDHFWPGATITTTWSEDPNDPRSGRWKGQDKTECGLHVPGKTRRPRPF